MSKQDPRYGVINEHGMALVIKDTKEEAQKEADQMSDYHQQTFSVKEI